MNRLCLVVQYMQYLSTECRIIWGGNFKIKSSFHSIQSLRAHCIANRVQVDFIIWHTDSFHTIKPSTSEIIFKFYGIQLYHSLDSTDSIVYTLTYCKHFSRPQYQLFFPRYTLYIYMPFLLVFPFSRDTYLYCLLLYIYMYVLLRYHVKMMFSLAERVRERERNSASENGKQARKQARAATNGVNNQMLWTQKW